MMLTDSEISKLIAENNLIENHSPECITNVGYDLITGKLYTDEGPRSNVDLNPHESVFVESAEIINLPKNIAAKVYLKNGRIRLGLTLDSPVYQPGHKTRVYFRLTNVSSNVITIKADEKYAMITFEKLEGIVNKPYNGAFADEYDFRGLGNYQQTFEKQIKAYGQAKKDLADMEKSIYGNVLMIITVFVAIFSLLSTNVTLAEKVNNLKEIIMYNAIILSGISFLMTLLSNVLDTKGKRVCAWSTAAVVLLAVILMII